MTWNIFAITLHCITPHYTAVHRITYVTLPFLYVTLHWTELLRITLHYFRLTCYIHRIHKNGGCARARHFRTDRIFVHGFLPFKEEPGISFSQRETEDIVSLLITLSTLPPTDAMLFSIPKCFDSMLPITHPWPLPRVRHISVFGVLRRTEWKRTSPRFNVKQRWHFRPIAWMMFRHCLRVDSD